ncbi:MAG: glycosyltransferase family 4 protein, partial [Calditrichaeota bacterium]|nr:glycosyltransferase family 4 protein [Calditrichota bacterium]
LTQISTYKLLPILKPGFSRYLDLSLPKKITSLINKDQFDSVIWEHPYMGWIAKRVKNKTGIRTIIHTHNIEYQRFRSLGKWWWPLLKMYEKRALKKADQSFYVTEDDRNFVVNNWNIEVKKTSIVPFGVDISEHPADKSNVQQMIKEKHGISTEEKILLFNGVLNYKPNLDALKIIIEKINPLLIQHQLSYKIIICGRDLPEYLNQLEDYKSKNIIYTGFVVDIESYFKAADIFLNPVLSGGGIKTKIVEAIAYGATVISTETGAIGLDKEVCGNKLQLVRDNEWNAFADHIIEETRKKQEKTPSGYYDQYCWEKIIERLLSSTFT